MSWFSALNNIHALDDAELSALHTQLQKNLKTIRLVLPLLVLAIISAYGFHMWQTIKSVKGEDVGAAFEKRGAVLLPKVQKMVIRVGNKVSRPVGEALAGEVDDLMAGFSGKLNTEMAKMKETLPKQMEGLLLRQMKEAREKQMATLQREFPELKDNPKKVQALMESFEMAFARWAQKMLVAHFNRHIKDLDKIKRTLNGFVAKQNAAIAASAKKAKAAGAGVKAAGSRVNPEQLLGLWLEIMEESIKGDGPIDLLADPAKDAKKGK